MCPQKITYAIVLTFIVAVFFSGSTTPVSAQNNTHQTITITALVDRDLMEKDPEETKREIKEIIKFVANIFEKEFDVTFTLNAIKPWEFPHGKIDVDADDALDDIQHAADYENSDITLGFTEKKLSRCTEQNEYKIIKKMPCPQDQKDYVVGLAFTPGKAAIMLLDEFIALHEVGHIFGANDSKDITSVMHENYSESKSFDSENKKIIQKIIKEKFRKKP